ncbi:MAG: hypothetical protein RL376_729, partial [Verrucomicrobiota bacterium]
MAERSGPHDLVVTRHTGRNVDGDLTA